MTATEPQSSEPELSEAIACACPRCGYDQRGVVRTWIGQCPMEGTCSECGLVFAWCEVLVPEKFEPRWCVEYEPRRLRVPWAAAKTLLQSLLPWRFWSRLKMSHAVCWRRLACYPLLLVFPLIPLFFIAQSGAAIMARYRVVSSIDREYANAQASLPQLERMLKTGKLEEPWLSWSKGSSATLYWSHVRDECANAKMMIASPPDLDISYAEAALEAITRPLGRYSDGTIVMAGQTYPYIAPIDIWDGLDASVVPIGWFGGGGFTRIAAAVQWLGLLTLLGVAMPLTFLLLPVTRRRAKVRWAHIGRIFSYGMFIPVACAYVFVACVLLSLRFRMSWLELLGNALMVGLVLMFAIWWWTAMRCYLRIPHAFFTTIVLLMLCGLSIASCIWLVNPGFLIEGSMRF